MKNIIMIILRYNLFLALYLLGVFIFKIRNRVKIIDQENLPHKSRTLYLSNHQTLADSLLAGISIVSIKELFFNQRRIPYNVPDRKNFLDHGFAKFFFGLLKNIPTDRNIKTRTEIENQIDSYCQVLEKDNLLIFFEGTRTRDGSIGPCKKGVAKTILKAKPDYVIPITLIGISDIMPIAVGFNYFKIKSGHRGKVIIGKAIDFSEITLKEELSEKEKIELICQKVKETIEKNYEKREG